MDVEMIDTLLALRAFLSSLPQDTQQPNLYMDLEGNDLCRTGTLSLVTILVEPRRTVHLVDVKTLGKEAFTTSDTDSKTLKEILESPETTKVFFDIRNDSDALYSHFGIHVQGIEDVQLMELASRNSSRRLLNGLTNCIMNHAPIDASEKHEWRKAKDQGHRLFDPAQGGSFAVFDQRPLTSEIQKYCVQDVLHMPALREHYKRKISDAWWARVQQETAARITLSQSAKFNGKGRHMAEGPFEWRRGILQGRDASPTRGFPPSVMGMGEDRFGVQTHASSRHHVADDDNQYDHDDYDGDDVFECVSRDLGYSFGCDLEEENDAYKDFTACDKECGYCGRCDY